MCEVGRSSLKLSQEEARRRPSSDMSAETNDLKPC